jgi:pyruvate/2-oxoglutarate dehydrogenase complex dihydrolipoamide dehydrogenase (E3) component
MDADISVLVVGGGPAGVTAAGQARELGARVIMLEAQRVGGTSLNRGPAPVRTLARAFAARGMTVATDTLVDGLAPVDGGISISYRGPAGPDRMVADAVFFAAGWPANLDHLNLDGGRGRGRAGRARGR